MVLTGVPFREYLSLVKSFEKENNSGHAACAGLLVETVPLVMRTIRREVQRTQPLGLSTPQVRALVCLQHHAGASLSVVAEFVGLTASSSSKLVDGLVQRRLVCRKDDPADRRRATLTLTAAGGKALTAARQAAQDGLRGYLRALPADEVETIAHALRVLLDIFTATPHPAAQ